MTPQKTRPIREDVFILSDEGGFPLELGGRLLEARLAYCMYGTPKPDGSNVVLLMHGISGDARALDWWPQAFGPGALLDPEEICTICVNALGSCYGSSGPLSIDPSTGEPYENTFPLVTIGDMARAQKRLLEHLGLGAILCTVGSSFGAMQGLYMAHAFPGFARKCVAIGATPLSAMGLGLNHLQRQVIALDAGFHDGRYRLFDNRPSRGLAIARALATCSYKSAPLFDERYARLPNRGGEDPRAGLMERFAIAGYLDHQGSKFVERFDANSYMLLTKAMDLFEFGATGDEHTSALSSIRADVLLVGIGNDWLFPPADVIRLADEMRGAGVRAEYLEIDTPQGHDGWLTEATRISHGIKTFLELS